MKKKVLALLLIVAMVAALCVGLVACGSNNDENTFKIGLICLHDENSTYDANFINAMKSLQKKAGWKDSQVLIVTGIGESEACYNTAVDLVNKGCSFIFADSFGHEDYMIQAAKEFPNVQFCHATGYQAAIENLPNFSNAFASIYEGRYLVGVAAGLKLLEMYGPSITDAQATIGYVGAFTYAEVVSGYSSFFLGVKSIVPNVSMKVKFTGSWYAETAEKEAAKSLIEAGCTLISQHADSMGAPTACEEKNVPNITYNISTQDACPNTFVAASRINWEPYFSTAISRKFVGINMDTNWTGTMSTDSVQVIAIGNKAAAGTKDALDAVKATLLDGSLKVFDVSKFQVAKTDKDGKEVVDKDGQVEYITLSESIDSKVKDGYYHESETVSAPSFSYRIKGITLLNTKF